jgi:hypothetical protein
VQEDIDGVQIILFSLGSQFCTNLYFQTLVDSLSYTFYL